MRLFGLILVICCNLFGQSSSALVFEVASVRATGPPAVGQGTEVRGGPGTADPGQITYERIFLGQVFRIAFGATWDFQISGPGWLDTERYNISAKIPAGTTQEQFRLMLQNLLVDRFALRFHREQKLVPAYDLTVAGGGSKVRESVPESNASPSPASSRTPQSLDKDGFPVLPAGVNFAQSLKNKRNRITIRMMTMMQLAGRLERELGRPVLDKTGLTGSYDFKLDYSIEGLGGQRWVTRAQQGLDADSPDDTGPSIFAAVQQQLGLKLEDRKAPFEAIVVDNLTKTPTGN
jgi:uncharacterized protein (TIGR03435 family)